MAAFNLRSIFALILQVYQQRRQRRYEHHERQLAVLQAMQKKSSTLLKIILNLQRSLYLYTLLKRKEARKPRLCRRFVRNSGWWTTVRDSYNDARFKETLRVSRETFHYILEKIRHKLERRTITEIPIPPDMRLALTLYKLGRGDYLYTIGEMSGLAVPTVCMIVMDTCRAITESLWGEHVTKHFPSSEADIRDAMTQFEQEWQFQYAFSAIDGSHLPIKCPKGGAQAMKAYFNFKGFYSIILMALVDANIASPGSRWVLLETPTTPHVSNQLSYGTESLVVLLFLLCPKKRMV